MLWLVVVLLLGLSSAQAARDVTPRDRERMRTHRRSITAEQLRDWPPSKLGFVVLQQQPVTFVADRASSPLSAQRFDQTIETPRNRRTLASTFDPLITHLHAFPAEETDEEFYFFSETDDEELVVNKVFRLRELFGEHHRLSVTVSAPTHPQDPRAPTPTTPRPLLPKSTRLIDFTVDTGAQVSMVSRSALGTVPVRYLPHDDVAARKFCTMAGAFDGENGGTVGHLALIGVSFVVDKQTINGSVPMCVVDGRADPLLGLPFLHTFNLCVHPVRGPFPCA